MSKPYLLARVIQAVPDDDGDVEIQIELGEFDSARAFVPESDAAEFLSLINHGGGAIEACQRVVDSAYGCGQAGRVKLFDEAIEACRNVVARSDAEKEATP